MNNVIKQNKLYGEKYLCLLRDLLLLTFYFVDFRKKLLPDFLSVKINICFSSLRYCCSTKSKGTVGCLLH